MFGVAGALLTGSAFDVQAREPVRPRPVRSIDLVVRRMSRKPSSSFPPATFHAPPSPASADLFAVTTALPDPARPGAVVDIVAWNPARVFVSWVPGAIEPRDTGNAAFGSIPPERARRVVAAFNGGFRAVHGSYGARGFGEALLPMKDGAATLIEGVTDDNVLGTWPLPVELSVVRSMRQNLPPLLEGGTINPQKRAPEQWGAVTPDTRDRVHAVRSGLCQRRDGGLLYLWGADLSPEMLGKAMLDAECTYGMHLDMNPGLTGFEFCRYDTSSQHSPAARPPGPWSSHRLHGRMSLATFPLCSDKRSPRDFFILVERGEAPIGTAP